MTAPQNMPPTASIGDVSRETGLSKETLRVWEHRYGFPSPARNHNDERVYPGEQIQRLRLIRRLLDSGLRPGKIVGLSLDELSAFDAPIRTADPSDTAAPHGPLQILELIKGHRTEALHHRLAQLLMQLGLRQFILEVIVPLNRLVGKAWLEGTIEIFEEHLYTQQVQGLLHQALGAMPAPHQKPRVLLTTLPGEEHQLGMLMALAFFAMDGAQCVPLGTQTPPEDIIKAVAAHQVDIVGLSCTGANSPRLTHSQLALLRRTLDPSVELWVGGSVALRNPPKVAGVRYVAALPELPAALAQWRAESGAL
jgi:DNA-binding transcriptional MerR regulator/methylmalonyl-CoA mutase cobalamin-binding subunit